VLGRKAKNALRIKGLTLKSGLEDSGFCEPKPLCEMAPATTFS
jgi:hypothetical protein